MRNISRHHLTAVLALFISLLLLFSIAFLKQRQDYETRGLIEGLPQPIVGGGVKVGVNVYFDRYDSEQYREVFEEISEAGFDYVKQPFYYSDNYDWSFADELFSAAEYYDIHVVALLDGNPKRGFAPPENLRAYTDWLTTFSKRYGDQINYYIIWDEPNLSAHWGGNDVNPAEYGALLSLAATTIRSTDPVATIIAAPLAPTVETGPKNLADAIFLQELYAAGVSDSFDIVASKPYGFNTGPDDREVGLNSLNFSRVILLREVMELNQDSNKAIWAGNWGWNSLPDNWNGSTSIWGQVEKQDQLDYTIAAIQRARREWPWMGLMFLENWEPNKPTTNPWWGFSIADNPDFYPNEDNPDPTEVAYPGFHLADDEADYQHYEGSWRFSPDYGADVGESGDTAEFRFWGTDIGLMVRRANYHSRLYVWVDGKPANLLPLDERGPALVLNSPDKTADYLAIEPIASNLSPGRHSLKIVAHRGSDQWALNGFSAGYQPDNTWYQVGNIILWIALFGLAILFVVAVSKADWWPIGRQIVRKYRRLSHFQQIGLTAIGAGLVALTGWLTWGEQAAGIYRRFGDAGQLTLTAATAGIFYISPTIILYTIALVALFFLVYLRPAWGLVLIAFSIPFYVKPKPIASYQFSPVEIFVLVTFAAFVLRIMVQRFHPTKITGEVASRSIRWRFADISILLFVVVATISLLFTERLDVATNEWRVLILEPVILYVLIRIARLQPREMWHIIDAFILSGIAIAIIGLWQYATGQNLITSEGGLMRLRSVYGSPNNVALYLGRIIPLLIAVVFMGKTNRRYLYALALLPILVAIILSYSKGALFLGMPASIMFVILIWRKLINRPLRYWILGPIIFGALFVFIAFQIPALAGRLNPQGATGVFRMNLWLSSVNMFRDHPLFGVGLDNFLYEYRGRYIFDAAWQEPNLSHPHNILLDFATRLGLLGLFTGVLMIWAYIRSAIGLIKEYTGQYQPVVVGIAGSLAYMLAHGIVDHSFFLVDLAYIFMFQLGILVWLSENQNSSAAESQLLST